MTITELPSPHTELQDELVRPPWLSQEQWPFTLRRHPHRTSEGTLLDVHYLDEGTGPVLVFVHAGMWSFVWRDVVAALRSDFRCIAVDFPGAGLSGGDPKDIDLATFPQVLSDVLDGCGVDEATFVVHDLGGVVGVLAAALKPERVTGLVATNSFAWAPDARPLRAMLRVMGSRFTTNVLGTFRLIPRLSRTKMGVGRHLDRAGRRAFFGPYRRRRTSRNFHRAMRSASRSRATFEAAEDVLRGPLSHVALLTVFGEKNDQFGFADRWQSLFPTAERWTVAGGNHFPMCDDPEGFVEHLTNWHRREVQPPSQAWASSR